MIAFAIVLLIIINLIVLLKRTKNGRSRRKKGKKTSSSATASSSGIATLQKRLFGRKNSNTEDPLPVVLLSYKADYDETLPIQGTTYFWPFGHHIILGPILANCQIPFSDPVNTVCGNFKKILSFRFYVKSSLENIEDMKLMFLFFFFAILGGSEICWFGNFSLQNMQQFIKKIPNSYLQMC